MVRTNTNLNILTEANNMSHAFANTAQFLKGHIDAYPDPNIVEVKYQGIIDE